MVFPSHKYLIGRAVALIPALRLTLGTNKLDPISLCVAFLCFAALEIGTEWFFFLTLFL